MFGRTGRNRMAGKEFGATVPEEEYLRFQVRFGGFYGATKWFITSALKEFNDRVEREPTLQLQIAQAIENMVQEAREAKNTPEGGTDGQIGKDSDQRGDGKVLRDHTP